MKSATALCFVQLVLVAMAASSLFMSTPAGAEPFDGARKSLFVERTQILAGPGRTTSCRYNATLCLDPKLSPAGPTCCASKCVNILTDVYNCGGCSRPCRQGWTCCKGQCVYTFTDSWNCGSCGKQCTKNSRGRIGVCSHGLCGYNGGRW